MKRALHLSWVLIAALLLGAYVWRVCEVNHSSLLDYAPEVIEYSENCEVPLTSGYYNRGYLKQDGYYAKITGTVLCRVDELNRRGIITLEEQELIQTISEGTWIIIVSADFHFEGDGDPLEGVIDLSDYQIVGPDYYLNCCTELNELSIFNKFLSGNSAFSIASGRTIQVEIPFLVNTDSVHSVDANYIQNNDVKILLSRYPVETYVRLSL